MTTHTIYMHIHTYLSPVPCSHSPGPLIHSTSSIHKCDWTELSHDLVMTRFYNLTTHDWMGIAGSWIQDPGSWTLSPGCWIQDPGSWIQHPGSRILHSGSWMQGWPRWLFPCPHFAPVFDVEIREHGGLPNFLSNRTFEHSFWHNSTLV